VEVAKPVKKKPAMPTTPSIMKRPAGYCKGIPLKDPPALNAKIAAATTWKDFGSCIYHKTVSQCRRDPSTRPRTLPGLITETGARRGTGLLRESLLNRAGPSVDGCARISSHLASLVACTHRRSKRRSIIFIPFDKKKCLFVSDCVNDERSTRMLFDCL
jgi:hypothetical protein